MRTLDPQEYEILQLIAQHRCDRVIRRIEPDEIPMLQRLEQEGRITVCDCSSPERSRPLLTTAGREALRLYPALLAMEAA